MMRLFAHAMFVPIVRNLEPRCLRLCPCAVHTKKLLQWSAVRVTAVRVTVSYSDSFGNPRIITNKTPLLTVTNNRLQ